MYKKCVITEDIHYIFDVGARIQLFCLF